MEEITEADVSVLADIMKRAFDDDTRMHTSLEEDGPSGYADGSLLRRLKERKIVPREKFCGMERLSEGLLFQRTEMSVRWNCFLSIRTEKAMESEPTPGKPSGGNFRRQEGGMWKPRTTPREITDSTRRSADSGS